MKSFGICLFFLVFLANALGGSNMEKTIESVIDKTAGDLLPIYKEFHQTPELSGQEKETAQRLAQILETTGYEVKTGIGGNGLVGILHNGEGPVLMIRTDLDALPITENTELSYASKVQVENKDGRMTGVMHACGHDMHMSIAAGTAKALAALKDQWNGTLIVLGQPAEEIGAGSKAMIKDGLFDEIPQPNAVLALHVHPLLQAGTVGITQGYSFANVDTVEIEVFGKGGHGAMPHECIDPVVMASQLVLSLQTIISRELNPVDPAVITVGSIHGGTKSNIIPNSVKLQITVRSMSDESRQQLIEAIRRKARAVAISAGLPESKWPTVVQTEASVPSVYNDPDLTRLTKAAFESALGPENVITLKPEMVGEDFSRYGRTPAHIPISMFRLGTATKKDYEAFKAGEKDLPGLHSSRFTPDPEVTLQTGIKSMVSACLAFLKSK